MRYRIALLTILALAGSAPMAAKDPKPPNRIVFPNTGGDVPFNHKAHIAREKKKCAACHPKLWPMSAKQPLTTSAGCRTCHHVDGRGFDTKDAKNCRKCHPTLQEKKG